MTLSTKSDHGALFFRDRDWHPAAYTPGYKTSMTRAPHRALVAMGSTLSEETGPAFGHSMIVDPWGRVLAAAGGTGEAIVLAEIDIAAVKAAHDRIPNLRNGRAFTLETMGGAAKGGVAA